MQNIRRFIDSSFKLFTPYKGIWLGLLSVLGYAFVLSLFGVLQISALGIFLMTLVLVVVSYATNYLLSKVYKAPFGADSWLISALILACILFPTASPSKLALAALAAVITIASKYVLTWRGGQILNPAAVGAFVISSTGLMPAAWWVATPVLLPATILLGVSVLYRHRLYSLFAVFAVAATLVMLFVACVLQGQGVGESLRLLYGSYPLLFLGTVMLTEPSTLPAGRNNRWLYALLVGVVFSIQLHAGPLATSPLLALLIGNVFAAIVSPPFSALLKVKKVQHLAADIVEVSFEKPTNLVFAAGQYLEWTLDHPNRDFRGNRRTFSIASAPSEADIRVAIRVSDPGSSYKKALQNLKPGDLVRAAKVNGVFTLPAGNEPLLLIAAGIGVTPFRSMIAQVLHNKQQRDIQVVFIARDAEHFTYKELLEQASKYGVKTEYVSGRLTADSLGDVVKDFAKRQVFISGPEGLVKDYTVALLKAGLSRRQLHTDHFTGY